MDRMVHIIVVLVVIVAAVAFTVSVQPPPEEKIKIGGAFALSGFGSEWGEAELRGATLAIEEANAAGGVDGIKLEMVVEDTATDNSRIVAALSKLIDVDGADVVIGPTWMDSFQGAAPLADDNRVLMITPSASITAIKGTKNFSYVFSTWYRTDKESEELVRHLSDTGRNRIVLFFGNDPFWQDVVNMVKGLSPKHGIEIAGEYKFGSVETDFRTILIQIKELDPDAVLFGLNNEQGLISMLQQRSVLYPDSYFYTTEYIEEFASKSAYEGLLENVYFVAPASLEKSFSQKYKERFGSEPVFSASNSYDATNMVIKAIRNGAEDANSIRAYLTGNEFDTVTFGRAGFDELGGIVGGEFAIKRISGGSIETLSSTVD